MRDTKTDDTNNDVALRVVIIRCVTWVECQAVLLTSASETLLDEPSLVTSTSIHQ